MSKPMCKLWSFCSSLIDPITTMKTDGQYWCGVLGNWVPRPTSMKSLRDIPFPGMQQSTVKRRLSMFLSPFLLQSNLQVLKSPLAFPTHRYFSISGWESPCRAPNSARRRRTLLRTHSYSAAQNGFFPHLLAMKKLSQQQHGEGELPKNSFVRFYKSKNSKGCPPRQVEIIRQVHVFWLTQLCA